MDWIQMTKSFELNNETRRLMSRFKQKALLFHPRVAPTVSLLSTTDRQNTHLVTVQT